MKHILTRTLIALVSISSLALLTESPPANVAEAQVEGIDITAQVTSYSSDIAETDDTPDITASNTHVHEGTLACPKRYPFGTKVRIEGKEYVCEDRMNQKKFPERFDVWQSNKEDAIRWGVRTLTITILQ
jgi:3D (Asp-Asp-Asp) domain-containing protein